MSERMQEREKFPSEAAERFQVRLPTGMRERIRVSAEASGRSMNADIVNRLEKSFNDWPKITLPQYIVDMAKESGQDELDRYEYLLNVEAYSLAKDFFSVDHFQIVEMISAFNFLIKDIKPERAAGVTKKLEDILGELTEEMPDSRRLRAFETVQKVLYRSQKS